MLLRKGGQAEDQQHNREKQVTFWHHNRQNQNAKIQKITGHMQDFRKRLYLCSKNIVNMMKRFFFIIYTILILSGCSRHNTPQEKFDSLKDADFSEFVDVGITSRPPVYIVRLHDTSYLVKKHFLSNRIKSITYYGNQNANSVNFTKSDKKHVEHLLHLFDNLDVRALSVDREGTVWFSFSCRDRCTYSYLKLSPTSSLEECGFQHYKKYNENWFYDVECSGHGRSSHITTFGHNPYDNCE